MKKNIWVLSGNRTVLVQVQRQINRGGGMRAVCLFSDAAVEKAMAHLGGVLYLLSYSKILCVPTTEV